MLSQRLAVRLWTDTVASAIEQRLTYEPDGTIVAVVPTRRLLAMLALAGTALNGCNDVGQRVRFEWVGTFSYAPVDDTAATMESWLRQDLARVHMEADDADCLVTAIKKSSYWKTDPPSLHLPAAVSRQFARDCEIDLTKLYVIRHDD